MVHLWGVKYPIALALAVAILSLSGCTTPCDEAADVITRQCFMEVEGTTEMRCEGERRAYAECVIDYPEDACDWFYDPVAAEGNAFDFCVRAIEPD